MYPKLARQMLTSIPKSGTREHNQWSSVPTIRKRPSSVMSGFIPSRGTDSAIAMAMGHVILREFYLNQQSEYFLGLRSQVHRLSHAGEIGRKRAKNWLPERFLRASDFDDSLGESNNSEWKTVAYDNETDRLVVPNGSIGFRWGEDGKWNLEERSGDNQDVNLQISLADSNDEIVSVAFPYFGGRAHEPFTSTSHPEILERNIPVKRVQTGNNQAVVATVFDLFCANYGLDRGFGGNNVASDFMQDIPYTPAWQEKITGVTANQVITVARAFASNADKTEGKSMVILGAGLNHWYHMDMIYRGIINMLVMCGCVGQSGGGWSHYVGQDKLRPQSGWLPLAFALDWYRPPRQMNSTSFWYAHTDQWRYEKLTVPEILSPTAPDGPWEGSLIDFNIRAERMGWLPSAPQLKQNPLDVAKDAEQSGQEVKDYVVSKLKSGEVSFACETPDSPLASPETCLSGVPSARFKWQGT